MPQDPGRRTAVMPSHVEGVDATSSGLIRSTLGAAIAAGAILGVVWLPAEYGVDPTGVGSWLGLTEMGEIKQQLAAEAEADDAAAQAAAQAVVLSASQAEQPVPASIDPTLSGRLDAIDAQLAVIAAQIATQAGASVGSTGERSVAGNASEALAGAMVIAANEPVAGAVADAAAAWRDSVDYELSPGEGVEIKLVMTEGETAEYEWTANGSVVNFDKHGDGNGQETSYEQGRAVPGDAGVLTAAFTGKHGWFWRNRTDSAVTVTLRTRGVYSEMDLP